LVMSHPQLQLAFATAHARAGERTRINGREIVFGDPNHVNLSDAELIFTALPHGQSAEWVSRARSAGAKVVDLADDLRPGSGNGSAPYGLPELLRARVRETSVVANPGCYPTAALLALAPLAESGLIAPHATINVVAASGVTGAGFTPKPELLFAEVAEDYRPYAVTNEHRHQKEVQAVLSELGCNADLIFIPHLLPTARGIIATITVQLTEDIADPLALWKARYDSEPFVEITEEIPSLRSVVRRNIVQIGVTRAERVRTPTLIIVAALDNLLKGAAGQAVQNANLMCGFSETIGLPS
jgi:N-acetyl-gamma-glutamyl-phosphate reductase